MELVTSPRAFAHELRSRFNTAGIDEDEISRRINYSKDSVRGVLTGRMIPTATMMESMLALLPLTPDHARLLYASRAAVEAGLQWQARRGREAVGHMQDEGVLDHEVRIAPDRTATVRLPRAPRSTRYVPRAGQPDPTGVSSPAELQQALQAVHVWGGSPSLRELEKRSSGVLRRSTISSMLRGTDRVIPDYDRYLAFLRACGISGINLDPWVFTWRRMVAQRQSPEVVSWMRGATARP
ncbi:hypothetical protein ACFXHD_23145 [Streptomyces hydrogenans]|uniref:hypothetical protein n=1 Tax=Streptomyces hydrogenans TaxID=1873719 RepID=UPI003688AA28